MLDIPADVPLILFLGRLHARKGVHYLIDALVHLPDAWLAVVGPDEGQGAALRDRAVRLGVDRQVVFTGLLTGVDKLAALYDADVLALPAVGEGLPMVALEAMMAGLPVALSEGCHLPEAISAGAGVALDVLDEAVIAAALQPILADAALRQTMGERGRQLVLSHFTWDAVVAEMLRFTGRVRRFDPVRGLRLANIAHSIFMLGLYSSGCRGACERGGGPNTAIVRQACLDVTAKTRKLW